MTVENPMLNTVKEAFAPVTEAFKFRRLPASS
jgi:hypothetical protein